MVSRTISQLKSYSCCWLQIKNGCKGNIKPGYYAGYVTSSRFVGNNLSLEVESLIPIEPRQDDKDTFTPTGKAIGDGTFEFLSCTRIGDKDKRNRLRAHYLSRDGDDIVLSDSIIDRGYIENLVEKSSKLP